MADTVRVLIADDDPLVRVGLSLVLGADPEIKIVGEASDGAEAVEMCRSLQPDVVLMDVRMPRMDGLAATEALRRDGPAPAIIVLTTFDTDENLLGALRLGANGFLLKDIAPTEILSAVRRAAVGESILSPAVVPRLIGYAVGRGADDGEPSRGRAGSGGGELSYGRAGSGGGELSYGRAGSGGDELQRGYAGSRGDELPRGYAGSRGGEPSRGYTVSGDGEPSHGRAASGGARAEATRKARVALGRLSEREREVAEAVATGRSNAEIGGELHMSVPTVKAYVSRVLDKLGCSNRVQIAILIHEAR